MSFNVFDNFMSEKPICSPLVVDSLFSYFSIICISILILTEISRLTERKTKCEFDEVSPPGRAR